MKNNASIVYSICLIIGDALALVAAFVAAFILRVTLSDRAINQFVSAIDYLQAFLIMLPFFILTFSLLGLYSKRIHEKRFNELGRLAVGVFIGILFVISYSYITNTPIFPARLVTVYGFGLAFFFVFAFRTVARGIRRQLFNFGVGINNVVVVGDTLVAHRIIDSMSNTAITGYRIQALVAQKLRPGRPNTHYAHYKTFSEAVAELGTRTHTIVQTELYADTDKNDEILTYAQQNHITYRFVPGNSELFVGNIEAEVFHSVPMITVHQTPLVGWGRVVKRLFDVFVAITALVVASPIMIITALFVKLTDGGPIFFKQARLSRFNAQVGIYKFRSVKMAYNGLSPEDAFTKMGRPELIRQYREHADSLPNDPRFGKFGNFIRGAKIDELPQLINVIRGDISLVGPRALVPAELDQYSQKNLILSVKSGLTGLAQVSGRADISFEERRKIDLYYVQNWTFWGDITILFKTVWIVMRRKGTR